jgi:hypothetical protein
VYIELWEATSMYQAMRGPCTGSRADKSRYLASCVSFSESIISSPLL